MIETRRLPRVLFVDDEPRLLQGLERQVRGLVTADFLTSPTAAAELLERTAEAEPFAAVVSDMRMPDMDGATLLRRAKTVTPDTSRLLLTGYSDINSAMAAVNEGSIFRFLMKPCSTSVLRAALDDAIEQHNVLRDRRELLERTLRGAIEALVETLTMAQPDAFARASRLRLLARQTAELLKLPEPWQIEIAAQLGEIGAITLPPEALKVLMHGSAAPTPAIARMLRELPHIAEDVLKPIPRLEGVRAIIRAQQPIDALDKAALEDLDEPSRLLQAIREYDALIVAGRGPFNAIEMMRNRDLHAPAILDALWQLASENKPGEVREVDVSYLHPGLVLAADLRSSKGILLVKDGHVITEHLLARIQNFDRLGGLEGRPLIYVDKKSA